MLPKTMKAAVVHKFGTPLTVEDVPVPRPESGQILVRIAASGVCHTDLHAAEGDWPAKPSLPLIRSRRCGVCSCGGAGRDSG